MTERLSSMTRSGHVDSIVSGGLRLQLGGGHGARLSRQRVTVPVNPPPAVEPHFVAVPAFTLDGRDEQIEAATTVVATGGRLGFHAPPGYGKTTLMRHLAALLAVGQPSGSVVYLRAGDGRVEDLLQRLFRALYRPAEPVRPTRRELLSLLGRAQSVVLLDDVALGPPAIEVLLRAIPECTVIVTAEWVLPGLGGRWLSLRGLDPDTGVELLTSTSGLPIERIGPDTAERLVSRVDGQPLAIRLAGALMREARSDSAELAERVKGDPGALERLVLTNLGDSELRTLATLSLADSTAVPVELIETLSDRTTARHDLVVLRRYGLVEQEDGRVWSTVHHGEPIRRALFQRLDLDQVTRATASWLEGLTLNSERARAAIPTVIAAIVLCAERGMWPAVIRLVGAIEPVLAVGARWQAWRDVLDQGLEAARAADDHFAEADFSHQLGTLETTLGRVGPGRALLVHALERRQALGDRAGAAVTKANLELLSWRDRSTPQPTQSPASAPAPPPPTRHPGAQEITPERRGPFARFRRRPKPPTTPTFERAQPSAPEPTPPVVPGEGAPAARPTAAENTAGTEPTEAADPTAPAVAATPAGAPTPGGEAATPQATPAGASPTAAPAATRDGADTTQAPGAGTEAAAWDAPAPEATTAGPEPTRAEAPASAPPGEAGAPPPAASGAPSTATADALAPGAEAVGRAGDEESAVAAAPEATAEGVDRDADDRRAAERADGAPERVSYGVLRAGREPEAGGDGPGAEGDGQAPVKLTPGAGEADTGAEAAPGIGAGPARGSEPAPGAAAALATNGATEAGALTEVDVAEVGAGTEIDEGSTGVAAPARNGSGRAGGGDSGSRQVAVADKAAKATTVTPRTRPGGPPRGAVSLSSTQPRPAPAPLTPPPSAPAASTTVGSPADSRPSARRLALVVALLLAVLATGTAGIVLVERDRQHGSAASNRAAATSTAGGSATATTTAATAQSPTILEPRALAFGAVAVGSASASQDLTVTNQSRQALSITGIEVDGSTADFLVNTRCAGVDLESGFRCRLGVRFVPRSPGTKSVTIRIGFDQPGAAVSASATGSGR
jgi:hypothetical protein